MEKLSLLELACLGATGKYLPVEIREFIVAISNKKSFPKKIENQHKKHAMSNDFYIEKGAKRNRTKTRIKRAMRFKNYHH